MSRVLCFLLVLTSLLSSKIPHVLAQGTGTIKGVVYDLLDREPLEGANVFISTLNSGASTNKKGEFEITIGAPFKGELVVSYVSYETQKIPIDVSESEVIHLNIFLELSSQNLDEIQVTASRVKQTVFDAHNFVTVTPKEKFVEKSQQTTADLLKDEPGILIQKTTHAHGAPIIRGLLGKYVLLLYNGVRLNKPTFRFGGNQYMNTISSEALSRIEVNRGPSSVFYGSEAIGGTVNLISYAYEDHGPAFTVNPEITSRYSSADDSRYIALNLKGGKEKFSFSGSVNYRKVENLDPGEDLPVQDPTGWEEINGNFSLFYKFNDKHVVGADYINVNQNNVPRYDRYASGDFDRWIYDPQKRRLYSFNYIYTPNIRWFNQMKWNISYQNEEEGRTERRSGGSTVTVDEDIIDTWGSYVQFSSLLRSKHWLSWGAEYYRDEVDSRRERRDNSSITNERGAFPDGSLYNSFGLYLQDNFVINRKSEIALGFRYSYFAYEADLGNPLGALEDDFDNVTGSINYKYKLKDELNLVASVSRGFRAPSFNDTIVLSTSNSGFDAPSPGLQPEKSMNYELGLKYHNESATGAWFIYFNRLSDLIDRRFGTYLGRTYFDDNSNGVQDPGEPPIFQKENVGEANIFGSELYAAIDIDSFSYFGQLYFTYGENITDDEPLSRIPPLSGVLGVKWQYSEKLWFEANTSFARAQERLSERDVLDSRIPVGGTPGYVTLNVKGGYSWATGRIVLRFENLFDKLYKTHGSGIYAAGRHFSVTYQFKTSKD